MDLPHVSPRFTDAVCVFCFAVTSLVAMTTCGDCNSSPVLSDVRHILPFP